MSIGLPDFTEKNLQSGKVNYYLFSKNSKTCISYWYNRIRDNIPEIKMPDTDFVFFNYLDREQILDSNFDTPGFNRAVKLLGEYSDTIGYPCFMKDGVFSGKHEWDKTCFISCKEDIEPHLKQMLYFQACVDCAPSHWIVIRRFIETIPAFKSHLGMPVNREFRFFVRDGSVYHYQPYWPDYSIEGPSIKNWKEELARISKISREEFDYLSELSLKVGNMLGHGWSIDWLQDKNGNWWLTDMATDNSSFYYKEYKPEFIISL